MKPENSSSGGDLPTSSTPATNRNQNAAANVIRSQIDTLYGDNPVVAVPAALAGQEDTNPYARTHDAHPQPQAEQWKQYHSAWQTYYQKYYEGMYAAR